MPSSRWKFYGGLLVVFLGAFLIYLASLCQGPDIQLDFVREVPSELDAATLDKAVVNTINWPRWFYSLAEAQVVNQAGIPYAQADQVIQKGSLVKLMIDPKKGKWRRFEVLADVVDYQPRRRIELRVRSDSTQRLTRLFDRLSWTVELLPRTDGARGTLIRGTGLAHTAHWRSRLFGKLAERILMNQVYYPNLLELAGLTQPSAQNPLLPSQQ